VTLYHNTDKVDKSLANPGFSVGVNFSFKFWANAPLGLSV